MSKIMTPEKRETEIQRLCNTLNTMGHFKIYGDDTKSEVLKFKAYGTYATECATDFAADCLRKIGFTDVFNDKTKKNFYHSVHATIKCEYDLNTGAIKDANVQDILALCDMLDHVEIWCSVFLPSESGQEMIPNWKHKSDLRKFLHRKNIITR